MLQGRSLKHVRSEALFRMRSGPEIRDGCVSDRDACINDYCQDSEQNIATTLWWCVQTKRSDFQIILDGLFDVWGCLHLLPCRTWRIKSPWCYLLSRPPSFHFGIRMSIKGIFYTKFDPQQGETAPRSVRRGTYPARSCRSPSSA
jgi:hypothetical protein